MDKLPEHKNGAELAKMFLEFFKHFTTLSATAAVGIVTLRGLVDLDPFWLALPLGGFGWVLVASVTGMYILLGEHGLGGNSQEGDDLRDVLKKDFRPKTVWTSGASLTGVLCFVYGVVFESTLKTGSEITPTTILLFSSIVFVGGGVYFLLQGRGMIDVSAPRSKTL